MIVRQMMFEETAPIKRAEKEVNLKKKLNHPHLSKVREYCWQKTYCANYYGFKIAVETKEANLQKEIQERRNIVRKQPKGQRDYSECV